MHKSCLCYPLESWWTLLSQHLKRFYISMNFKVSMRNWSCIYMRKKYILSSFLFYAIKPSFDQKHWSFCNWKHIDILNCHDRKNETSDRQYMIFGKQCFRLLDSICCFIGIHFPSPPVFCCAIFDFPASPF